MDYRGGAEVLCIQSLIFFLERKERKEKKKERKTGKKKEKKRKRRKCRNNKFLKSKSVPESEISGE